MKHKFSATTNRVRSATIRDFGEQWEIHGNLREDYWTSGAMLVDYFAGIFEPNSIKDKVVLEVGSGSGRILRMLSRFNPRELIGVEPSKGFNRTIQNTSDLKNLTILNVTGAEFKVTNVDIIFSLGVIHHIKNPEDTLVNIYESLKPGGQFVCWVYGMENNRTYVLIRKLISPLTRLMSDKYLDKFCEVLQSIIVKYGKLSAKYFSSRLPISEYIQKVFTPCGAEERKYIVFDQLNPAYAKYYTKKRIKTELENAGFVDVNLAHRHGYSWTAVGTK